MESPSSNPPKKQKTFPPRRGQIKAQIFENLVETVSSVATKAREVLSKVKGGDDGVGTPASTTPQPSAYTSYGSPTHA